VVAGGDISGALGIFRSRSKSPSGSYRYDPPASLSGRSYWEALTPPFVSAALMFFLVKAGSPIINGTKSPLAWCRVRRKRVEQYMSLSNQFGGKTLAMQVAVSLACKELGIGETDRPARETVTVLMSMLAKRRPVSIDRLKTFAVSQYRMLK
jgi:hypothetical protein